MPIIIKALSESIRIDDSVTGEAPEYALGWLGSFERTSTAELIIQALRDDGTRYDGLGITAYVYHPKTGLIWNTIPLNEKSIGIYNGYFKIGNHDSPGSYPVTMTVKSVVAPHFGSTLATLYGFVCVYIGTPGGISFR